MDRHEYSEAMATPVTTSEAALENKAWLESTEADSTTGSTSDSNLADRLTSEQVETAASVPEPTNGRAESALAIAAKPPPPPL